MSRFGTPPAAVGGPLDRRVPVRPTHHDLRAVALLQLGGALIVIAVRVADDHVLDVVRIQAQLCHPVDDLRPCRPREVRIDDDDAGAGLKRPRRMLARAQPVEIVEHFERGRIPVGAVRRLGRAGAAPCCRSAASCTAAARGAGQTEIDERAAVFLSRGGLGCRDVGVNLAERRLREDGGANEHGRERENHDGCAHHTSLLSCGGLDHDFRRQYIAVPVDRA